MHGCCFYYSSSLYARGPSERSWKLKKCKESDRSMCLKNINLMKIFWRSKERREINLRKLDKDPCNYGPSRLQLKFVIKSTTIERAFTCGCGVAHRFLPEKINDHQVLVKKRFVHDFRAWCQSVS
jgi:hypothetical protein